MNIQKRFKIKYPVLLVFQEKHASRFFNIDSDASLFRVSLKVLKERWEEGYWYYPPEKPVEPSEMQLSKEQIESLPEGSSTRKNINSVCKSYRAELAFYKSDKELYEQIQKALVEKDGELAFKCLDIRKDAEYEGFTFEEFEE